MCKARVLSASFTCQQACKQRARAWAQGKRRWVQGLSLHPRVPSLQHRAGQCRELCLQRDVLRMPYVCIKWSSSSLVLQHALPLPLVTGTSGYTVLQSPCTDWSLLCAGLIFCVWDLGHSAEVFLLVLPSVYQFGQHNSWTSLIPIAGLMVRVPFFCYLISPKSMSISCSRNLFKIFLLGILSCFSCQHFVSRTCVAPCITQVSIATLPQ